MKYYVLDGSVLSDCPKCNQMFNRMINFINDNPPDRLVFLNVHQRDFNKLRFLNCCLLVEVDIVFRQNHDDYKTQVALSSDVLQFNDLVFASFEDAIVIVECDYRECRSELIYFDFFLAYSTRALDNSDYRYVSSSNKSTSKN